MKKVLIGLSIAALVVLLTCLGGVIWFVSAVQPPSGIAVSIEQPDVVSVGETFDLVITISNAENKERRLYDIDLWPPLLDGASVLAVDPKEQSYDGVLGFDTYTMQQPIPPNGDVVVTFTLRADTVGVYRGDLDVSIDGVLKVHTTPHMIRVDP